MRWPDHAIWWHVYPLGFVGAFPGAHSDGAGREGSDGVLPRLERLTGWLDHLVELGCNGLALGPVFASETHGYDTVDHYRVDPRLGGHDDLQRLIDEASRRGVRVLLDGVFNHVGRSFPPFADVATKGDESPYRKWFHADQRTFEGHDRLVTLNHAEDEVADYVTDVMTHWLERGIDGWRLDAAYAVPPEFWRLVVDRVRARFPDAWFVGEVIHGDYAKFVEVTGLDSVTQYELWKAIWSSMNDRNFFELAHAVGRHNDMLASFVPQTFIGNHDVTRIASRLHDERNLAHALVVLMTVGGVPSIYAGDEFVFHGVKEEREGGDDAVRPTFPERPEDTPGYGQGHHRLHQELIGLRRRHPWLVHARTDVHALTNTALSYTVRHDAQRLAVVMNLDEQPVTVDLPHADWTCVAGEAHLTEAGVTVPPVGWAIAEP